MPGGSTISTKTFTIADPRTFDGDPFEVAERAALQAAGLARLLAQMVEGASLMARNAELERQLQASGECDPSEWEDHIQRKRMRAIQEAAEDAERTLNVLSRAAGYNPRRPPKA